jgi:helix-turn-helix protein
MRRATASRVGDTDRFKQVEQNMKLNTADPIARYGFTQLPNFILRNPDLSANAKTAYSLLLSYAWHNNLCFPGQERLAEHMGSHVSTVSRAITELEDVSLIEIERRGQGQTHLYTINFIVKKKPSKA